VQTENSRSPKTSVRSVTSRSLVVRETYNSCDPAPVRDVSAGERHAVLGARRFVVVRDAELLGQWALRKHMRAAECRTLRPPSKVFLGRRHRRQGRSDLSSVQTHAKAVYVLTALTQRLMTFCKTIGLFGQRRRARGCG